VGWNWANMPQAASNLMLGSMRPEHEQYEGSMACSRLPGESTNKSSTTLHRAASETLHQLLYRGGIPYLKFFSS
jgi:hypothetical protein